MLIESERDYQNRDTYIHKMWYDEEKERHEEIVSDFTPYIFVEKDRLDMFLNFTKVKKMHMDVENPEKNLNFITIPEKIEDYEQGYEGLEGEELIKLYVPNTGDIRDVKEKFEETDDEGNVTEQYHHEADVGFTNRYMIDKMENIEKTPLRIHYMDIEISDFEGFGNVKTAKKPIMSISFYDNFEEEYYVYTYKDAISVEKEEYTVKVFKNEREMITEYLEYIQDTKPQILTGWNFSKFDAQYLVNRIENGKLIAPGQPIDGEGSVDLGDEEELFSKSRFVDSLSPTEAKNMLSPLKDKFSQSNRDRGLVWNPDDRDFVRVSGVEIIDLLKAYKMYQYGEKESYSLDNIAKDEIDAEKIVLDKGFFEMYDEEFDLFLDYNKRDVELTVELNEKLEILEFWDELRRICKCSMEEILISMRQVDNFILNYVHWEIEDNLILPSKSDNKKPKFAGGHVAESEPGLTEDVAVMDLKCLSGDMDVVTPDGIRNIKDIKKGDKVYSFNPETEETEIKKVTQTYEFENKFGELYHLKGRHFDLKMTPNHRMLSRERRWGKNGGFKDDDWTFKEIQDHNKGSKHLVPVGQGVKGDEKSIFDLLEYMEEGRMILFYDIDIRTIKVDIPDELSEELVKVNKYIDGEQVVTRYVNLETYRKYEDVIKEHFTGSQYQSESRARIVPDSHDMNNFLKLIAWYISEGYCGDGSKISISKSKEKSNSEWKRITSLLNEMGYDWDYRSSEEIIFYSSVLSKFLKKEVGRTSGEKSIPDFVFELSKKQKKLFYETLIDGDGTRLGESVSFSTSSDQLIEDMIRLNVEVGKIPQIGPNNNNVDDVYSIDREYHFDMIENAEKIDHDGKVYCLEVEDNHTFLAGKGKFTWTGNSLYPSLILTFGLSPEVLVEHKKDADIIIDEEEELLFEDDDPFLPKVFDEFFDKRAEFKKKMKEAEKGSRKEDMYDNRQRGVKITMNTVYGTLSNPYFRLFEPKVGKAITRMGRETIKWSADYAENYKEDFNYVYADSVLPDEPVFVRNDRGQTIIREVQDLDDINEVWTDEGWVEIEKVIEKPLKEDKDVYKVETENSEVHVTEDHSLLDKNGNKIKPQNAEGEELLTARTPSKFSNPRLEQRFKRRAEGSKIEDLMEKLEEAEDRKLGDPTVESVEKVDTEEYDKVYDLQTENHHFHAGAGTIIVHNTDSIFVSYDNEKTDLLDLQEFLDDLNDSYDEFAQRYGAKDRGALLMQFEKVYERMFMTQAKKRYASRKKSDDSASSQFIEFKNGDTVLLEESDDWVGVGDEIDGQKVVKCGEVNQKMLNEPELDVTGFELVRSDYPEFAKELQREVLWKIVSGVEKSEIMDHIKAKRNKLLDGEYDLDEVGIPKGINKKLGQYQSVGPHIRGVKYSNKYLGTNMGQGDKVKLAYVSRAVGNTSTDVVAFQESNTVPDEFAIDWKKMEKKLIKQPLDRIFKGMDWSHSDYTSQMKITDL